METLNDIIETLESGKSTLISALLLATGITAELLDTTWAGVPLWGTILLSGIPLLYSALAALITRRRINSALLVSIGMGAAIATGETMAAAEIALIMAVGELLEHGTTRRARKGLEQIIRQRPTLGRRLVAGAEELVPVEEIHVGDVLRVKPGEQIPLDGTVQEGMSSVDQALLTGESLPEDKRAGSKVFAGTCNGEGCLDIIVTRTEADSALQRMISLVENSRQRQAPTQREVDRWASWLVPCSLLLAISGFVVLRFAGFEQHDALLRAVTVLVTFCPCGLALATPTCMMAAIGQATRHGVIIKGGDALEALGKVDTLAFDKTGTLTVGKPAVHNILTFAGHTEIEVLQLAAAVEQRSEHLLAKAVVQAATGQKLSVPDARDFRSITGRGVEACVLGRQICCGTAEAMQMHGIELSAAVQSALGDVRSLGMATIIVAVDGEIAGLIALNDTVRPEAPSVLQKLQGYHRVLLTGDHRQAAESLSRGLDLDEICADLLPEDKSSHILHYRETGHGIAMVGDGANDAPALKTASVGISMSRLGSDVATGAADISLLQDDLTRLPYLLRLSRATLRSIRFNIGLALAINFVAVILGLFGVLTPLTGALIHNAGSLLVILNAALLYERDFTGTRGLDKESGA